MTNLLTNDLNHILAHTKDLWEELRGQRIFITGGTGFFGCWLLESFIWANDQLDLKASAVVLTRNPDSFRQKAPHLANHPAIQFPSGDVRSFQFPEGEFSYIIHGATEASAKLNQEDPLLMFDTIIEGTRHTLEFAKFCQAKKFLLTSSGAVYGKQPPEITHVSEDYLGSPDLTNPGYAYAEGKRAAEMLCTLYAKQHGLETKIARCFAFVGPYLPLDVHFAIGNFIRDGIMAIWLWTILFKGKSCYPYNVGSDEDLTIAELAKVVASTFASKVEVIIAKEPIPGKAAERYVPSVRRAFSELQLKPLISLSDSIIRTASYNSSKF
jgi:nucleoside-diphosphate-sugar epimerase